MRGRDGFLKHRGAWWGTDLPEITKHAAQINHRNLGIVSWFCLEQYSLLQSSEVGVGNEIHIETQIRMKKRLMSMSWWWQFDFVKRCVKLFAWVTSHISSTILFCIYPTCYKQEGGDLLFCPCLYFYVICFALLFKIQLYIVSTQPNIVSSWPGTYSIPSTPFYSARS